MFSKNVVWFCRGCLAKLIFERSSWSFFGRQASRIGIWWRHFVSSGFYVKYPIYHQWPTCSEFESLLGTIEPILGTANICNGNGTLFLFFLFKISYLSNLKIDVSRWCVKMVNNHKHKSVMLKALLNAAAIEHDDAFNVEIIALFWQLSLRASEVSRGWMFWKAKQGCGWAIARKKCTVQQLSCKAFFEVQ